MMEQSSQAKRVSRYGRVIDRKPTSLFHDDHFARLRANFDLEYEPDHHNSIHWLYHEDTEMIQLVQMGAIEELRQAIENEKAINDEDRLNRTLLHLAIENGLTEIVKLLLEKGLDPNAVDALGLTPLFYATIRRPSVEIVETLFQHGATMPAKKYSSDLGLFLDLILMCKPTPSEKKIIQLLLEKGARLEDATAPGGMQALHYAAMINNIELITFLVELGADLYVLDNRRMSPLVIARRYQSRAAQFCLENEAIEKLIDRPSSFTETAD